MASSADSLSKLTKCDAASANRKTVLYEFLVGWRIQSAWAPALSQAFCECYTPEMTPGTRIAPNPQAMLEVAIEQARIGLAEGGVPVGGAIFKLDGTLLGAGRNRLVQNGDPSMHGETDAFRAAGRQPRYTDLILVTTLTPCRYCSGLISQFRFKQVIVGDSVNAQGGVYSYN